MNIRHGFLECHHGFWARIDTIHQVRAPFEHERAPGGTGSVVFTLGANNYAGGGLPCDLSVEEVIGLVERERRRPSP